MKPIVNINNIALLRSSYGIKKYYNEIYSRLERYIDFRDAFVGRPLKFREFISRVDGVFWCPSQSGSLNSSRQIITIHDLISINYTHAKHPLNLIYKTIFQKVISRSCLLVAISDFTKASILENFKVGSDKIVVIKSPNRVIFDSSVKAAKQEANISFDNYILTVTNSLPHKNNLIFIKGFQASELYKLGCMILFVGHPGKDAVNFMDASGLKYKVLNKLNDSDLDALYRGCLFYYSSSIIEGHNLTIAEAKNAGASVLCSDIRVHREFYDGDVYFFNPYDVESIRGLIDSRIYLNKLSNSSLIRTFDHVADDYMSLFSQIS